MSLLFWLLLFIVILIIVISRTVVLPLAAGTTEYGAKAVQNLKRYKISNSYPLVAAIVEPREQNLVKIINHFMTVLPQYTHFQVYHGTKNIDLIYKHFKPYILAGKISLWNLGVENLTINSYNTLLTSKEFWNTMQSERVLIFQTDAITCGRSNVQLEEFYKYDFVGAPLTKHILALIQVMFLGKGYMYGNNDIYNGGLSFRKKSKMLKVLEEYPWDGLTSEDVWFCYFLPEVGGVLPTREEASRFSFETGELVGTPWGLHKPRKEWDRLCDICPEVKEIPFVPAYTDYRSLYLL